MMTQPPHTMSWRGRGRRWGLPPLPQSQGPRQPPPCAAAAAGTWTSSPSPGASKLPRRPPITPPTSPLSLWLLAGRPASLMVPSSQLQLPLISRKSRLATIRAAPARRRSLLREELLWLGLLLELGRPGRGRLIPLLPLQLGRPGRVAPLLPPAWPAWFSACWPHLPCSGRGRGMALPVLLPSALLPHTTTTTSPAHSPCNAWRVRAQHAAPSAWVRQLQ